MTNKILKQISKLPKEDCPECGGTGNIQSAAEVGALLRRERESRDISLREISRRMGFSPPYLSDLEHGRRGMKAGLLKKYLRALEDKS